MPRSPPSSSPMPPTAAGRGSARRSCSLSARASPASRTFPALVNSAVEGSVMAADKTVPDNLATWSEVLAHRGLTYAAPSNAQQPITHTLGLPVAAAHAHYGRPLTTPFPPTSTQ